MKEKLKKIYEKGINSNVLKSIALVAMLIDHIGYYFNMYIPETLDTSLRIIGRIAMPIFTYLIVQGFFHTKSFKKYLMKISIFAVITQVMLTIIMIINKIYVPGYSIGIYLRGNILFVFALSLIILKTMHERTLIAKWDYNKNMLLKIFIAIAVLVISMFIPLDYGVEVLLLSALFYLVEKLKVMLYINKSNGSYNIGSVLTKQISYEKIRFLYTALLLFCELLVMMYFNMPWYMLFSMIPIALYNGERGKKTKLVKNFFYLFFPLHHVLLYSVAMVITMIKAK